MQLHQRGVDLLVNVQDAADHIDTLGREELHRLLQEVSTVLGGLLARDIPISGPDSGQPDMSGWDTLKETETQRKSPPPSGSGRIREEPSL